MRAVIRARSIQLRALALSVAVHAFVLASVIGAPTQASLRWRPSASAFIDVALQSQAAHELGGSTMPALPDALAAPVVTGGDATRVAPTIVRRRMLAPRRRTDQTDATPAPPIDLESAPLPDEESSVPRTAPSSIRESTSTATEPGSGAGEGGGTGDGAPSVDAPSEAARRNGPVAVASGLGCIDPWVGVWTTSYFQGAPYALRVVETLRITRSGAHLDLDVRHEEWVGYESDRVMPPCGSRHGMGQQEDFQSSSHWRASVSTDDEPVVQATADYVHSTTCGAYAGQTGRWPITFRFELGDSDHPDLLFGGPPMWRFTRTSCGDR
jgi:hypothetical protein